MRCDPLRWVTPLAERGLRYSVADLGKPGHSGGGFRDAGHDVTFIDINEARVSELKERGWDARTAIDLTDEPESLIFLTLPTPHEGHRYDLTAFTAGTASVGKALAGSSARHTVVVRSTVPPGTTEGLVKMVLEENSGMVAG